MIKRDLKVLGYNEVTGIYKLKDLEDGVASDNPRAYEEEFVIENDGIENVLRFSLISRQLRWLQGELLTILEASIDDERKLKAVKDLTKDKISAKISWIYEICGKPKTEESGLVDPTE